MKFQHQNKKLWEAPKAIINAFTANDSISACGTGTCDTSSTGHVPGSLLSEYHYELVGTEETVRGDQCQQQIDITDVDTSFFNSKNAQAVSRDPFLNTKMYVGELSGIQAWYYNGHLFSNVSLNQARPNHS